MANDKHLEILGQGVKAWNEWRNENLDIQDIDLSLSNLFRQKLNGINFSHVNLEGANLFKADLSDADLSNANLEKTNLFEAELHRANLQEARVQEAILFKSNLLDTNLTGADFTGANLYRADFRGSNLLDTNFDGANLYGANFCCVDLRGVVLRDANLTRANLSKTNISGAILVGCILNEANLSGSNLSDANLSHSSLIKTIVDKAKISKSVVYGVNIWDLVGEFSEQQELIITPAGESVITVDNIKIAQFIYLILSNKEIQNVINTLTSKAVLILGRFSLPERKAILDALRDKLREYDLLPIVFDFDCPTDKDFTETIKTLAGISYFVIADVTNPKSSPLELQATVPDYQIPFVPIIQDGERPFAMMVDLQKKYTWVLNTVTYNSIETLIKVLKPLIIAPAMKKHQELRLIKAKEPEVISGKDFLERGKE